MGRARWARWRIVQRPLHYSAAFAVSVGIVDSIGCRQQSCPPTRVDEEVVDALGEAGRVARQLGEATLDLQQRRSGHCQRVGNVNVAACEMRYWIGSTIAIRWHSSYL